MYLWDIRIASRVPIGVDPAQVEDLLFDALQDAEGIDLWTSMADPQTGRVEAHFGLLVEAKLQPPEALQIAIVKFAQAAAAAGWTPGGGDAEVVAEESHFEVTYQGVTEDAGQPVLALA